MLNEANISLLIQLCTLLGIIFGVFLYFKKPQEKGEIVDAIFETRFTQFDRELANLRDNHIHTIGVKLDAHIETQQRNEMIVCEKLARLESKVDLLLKK
jgi:hypothetical protein